ncbi:MAG: ribosome biogenesis GTPase Der [Chloroflexi bacterium AL-W]|nr:ribosome biogenesis GTPase Der [Chloroflexi bacterium AL-N1]NOK71664.1 ribosome biogenesis GTPase Der [Chloroflexi bacterium AL-N10]NOK79005.1 ribosome biogenesis GTPase Der [Chloroflexi bacterium AL-N5]NOK86439.1 ribosome biogenesis GTPase Der [Chloroflexi bacterium AL-W]NOK93405.1 ribosome biogenesis GTPase Der [Chloroflexi bacterium AL-N15]
MKPIVAIVGRPNVGKSTFFNRLIGERKAITEDIPGTTRDRLYGDTDWNGRVFTVVDTAGLLFEEEDDDAPLAEIARRVREQAQLAIDEADAIIFMVDSREGLTTADVEVAEVLRLTSKPVILAANKADNPERSFDAVEFYSLNIGDPIAMSAYHGLNTGDVLDALTENLPVIEEEEADDLVKVAIVGRPNVGKSSLLNKLLGTDRSVVSAVPGTTRDSIDTLVHINGIPMLLIDTAGVRRRGKIDQGIEKYSVLRAMRAIERADVALLLVDAEEGVTAQDTHIAGMILERLKGVAILVNKWDLIVKDDTTFNTFADHIRAWFKFVPYAPILFVSALTGQRVDKVLPLALDISDQRHRRISTSDLNDLLRKATYEHPPTSVHKGAHLRLYYATQPQVNPPVFLFFTNDANQVHWGYGRYLENRIRDRYGFDGTPIKVVFRTRDEKKDKKRR